MKITRTLRIAAAALLLTASRGWGHHAFAAEYDENKIVDLSGSVTGFKWANPHAWLYVQGSDESGKAALWSFEMGSPGGLVHRGWKKGEVKKGDRVRVDAFASKHRANVANARTVSLPSGRKLFGGFQSTPGNPAAK